MMPLALLIGTLIANRCDTVQIEAGKALYQGRYLKMDEQIALEIGQDKKLTCNSAEYDPQTGRLHLHSSIGEKIHYQDSDVSLSCNEAHIELGSDFQIKRLETSGEIEIVYQDGVTATSENADYQSGDDGYILLTGTKPCVVKSAKGDTIYAKTITFFTNQSKVIVENPKGIIATEPFVTHFEANQLTWDRENDDFTFLGDAKIRQNKLGAITVSDKLVLNKKNKNLHGEGCIELSFLLSNTLKCNGTLDIDHSLHMASIHSPAEPIIFQDARGEIQAHRASVHYLGDDKPLFIRFVAEDDVRINSYATVGDVISETLLHTIMTDRAELNAGMQSLTLTADEGKRTLLYDHINHLQVSAPTLKVQRDIATSKDKIEGVGDVRFSFTEQELERFKQQLSWIK